MDILQFHKNLMDKYRTYIQSFLNIKDPAIRDFVASELGNRKLWPEPLIQFNPTFENGRPLSALVQQGQLHPELGKIFRGIQLYRHQEEAILQGVQGKEFIVTSGTGSGKSLTYLATIFHHVLSQGSENTGKIYAVIVYPMNALINSQFQEIEKFRKSYEATYEETFPITFQRYTGQESEEERENLKSNPPHILLTNYMMLELIMTRGGRDIDIRNNFLQHMQFLVFDELHTYRGRQGSDVAMLIRRIRAAASNRFITIGTSATMISGQDTPLSEQKQKVAEVASLIFGVPIQPDQIINEYLVRSIGPGQSPTVEQLKEVVLQEVDPRAPAEVFEHHPTAHWIEEHIVLQYNEGVWLRRKPLTLSAIAQQLADVTGLPADKTSDHLWQMLLWANQLNTRSNKNKNYLPFRIHQFIAQTGSVYTTLGDQKSRKLYLDAGLYADRKDTMIYPLVFSRASGHEFICVKLNHEDKTLKPWDFSESWYEEDEESYSTRGYLFIQHAEDEEPIWDPERDLSQLPDSWFNPLRKDGTRKLKKDKEDRLPRRILFNSTGQFLFVSPGELLTHQPMEYEGWFMPFPLLFDPTSLTFFDTATAEWTKVMKLSGEGRSTATTVLSFETISQLHAMGEPPEKQKLLSFTDNRQDASLQAGHFNDFVKAGQLRAAIVMALEKYGELDYSNIADKVFECLQLSQEQYVRQPTDSQYKRLEHERVFKDYIMYRLLHDLRRSWRVVMPNLEQCALLRIEYKHLQEEVHDPTLWQENALLSAMSPEQRLDFLQQVFDYFRKSYALNYHLLEPGEISLHSRKFRETLKAPWNLDEHEKLEVPNVIHLEKILRNYRSEEIYTVSAGLSSVFGRYLVRVAREYGLDIHNREAYKRFTFGLFDLLCRAGWLIKRTFRTPDNDETYAYQLLVNQIRWCKGDGRTIIPDRIKHRSFRQVTPVPNEYFQQFYRTNFHHLKQVEGREHTGQISIEKRKQREEEFRAGKIGVLFCSPTMELGIDIADLSVVHMRNVPPSPARYVQRSGRAGRSGQAALVLVYCSNFNAHDRHYFKHAEQMVSGIVTPPRMDLINQELLLSHLNALILTRKSLSALNNSLGDLVEKNIIDQLPLRQEITDVLRLSDQEKETIFRLYKKVMDDSYFHVEMETRKPTWFTDGWIRRHIDDFVQSFDRSLDRWRKLYQSAQRQIREATSIIENRTYADSHEKKKEAYRTLRQAERQRDLLLNALTEAQNTSREQTEFYPYRYLASEGFLPGYNFTRLPVRIFLESADGGGEFISRARFIALSEFGPRNVVYHDGAKYRVDRMILTEAELRLEKAKISPKTGYFLHGEHYNYEVDPLINEPLQLNTERHVHTTLIELGETRAYQLERITCQEEERIRTGYDIRTYFAVDGGMENTVKGIVRLDGDKLLNVHYLPACRIYRVNLRWRASGENGFPLHLHNGYWKSKKEREEIIQAGEGDRIRNVKLYTSNTANALYLQPIESLGLGGANRGVITLMYAIKRAIENYFQVESDEIDVALMGEEESANILVYESAEGSLGVLSQIVDNTSEFGKLMDEAYRLCFVKNGVEEEGEVVPATYDDLLSYYNQFYHPLIDRNLIREPLKKLRHASLEILENKAFSNYEEQYRFLLSAIDPLSDTEEKFLKFLYAHGLKLPDQAQPRMAQLFVRPDFFYRPNVLIFCDGTPHDQPHIREQDQEKRLALKNAGYRVLSWYYREPLHEFVAKYPDIFKKVKDHDHASGI